MIVLIGQHHMSPIPPAWKAAVDFDNSVTDDAGVYTMIYPLVTHCTHCPACGSYAVLVVTEYCVLLASTLRSALWQLRYSRGIRRSMSSECLSEDLRGMRNTLPTSTLSPSPAPRPGQWSCPSFNRHRMTIAPLPPAPPPEPYGLGCGVAAHRLRWLSRQPTTPSRWAVLCIA